MGESTADHKSTTSVENMALMRQAKAATISAWMAGAVALTSGLFAWMQTRDQVGQQYVAMAVGILSKEASAPGTAGELTPEQKALRKWASTLLNSKLEEKLRLDEASIQALTEGSAQLYGYTLPNYSPPSYSSTSYSAPIYSLPNYQTPTYTIVIPATPASAPPKGR